MRAIFIQGIITILAGAIGYWFALRGTRKRIVAEKRAEYVSEFVGRAYDNLRYLYRSQSIDLQTRAIAVPEFSVLGDRAAFFLGSDSAMGIRKLTTLFAEAVIHLNDPEPGTHRDVWGEYRTRLDQLCRQLRKELQVED